MSQLLVGLRHRQQSNRIFEGQNFCKVKISHLDEVYVHFNNSVVLAFARKFALLTVPVHKAKELYYHISNILVTIVLQNLKKFSYWNHI